jgi:hypothetical protein
MFVPGCGLFPTWISCPLPSQRHLQTIRASFRIFNTDELDSTVASLLPKDDTKDDASYEGIFARQFPGLSCCFNTEKTYPNPPPAAHNFYRLLASFFALGPAGMLSPTVQQQHRIAGANPLSTCRYTVKHLIIDITSGKAGLNKPRRRPSGWSLSDEDGEDEPTLLPYQYSQHPVVSPPSGRENALYVWNGPTRLWNGSGAADGSADRLGFYLANMLWSLLDFKWYVKAGLFVSFPGRLGSHRVSDSRDAATLLPNNPPNPVLIMWLTLAEQAVAGLWADSVRGHPRHGRVSG